MKERPILFSAPMVRALLAGTKTQTRRIFNDKANWHFIEGQGDLEICPYGKPGDRLWVREAFAFTDAHMPDYSGSIEYRADNKCLAVECGRELVDVPHGCDPRPFAGPWKPSIHMPRWASRIMLEITGVRVERLQDISHSDAMAEGVEALPSGEWRDYLRPDGDRLTPGGSFRTLWQSINGAESWDANPYVWVVEFKRIGG